ncbi:hypothetical protein QMK19_03755 [Streptomyces sp. H10-C2]|uniref:hypothetical protein n=1 Tax=unclassified Streptomyces TaxID=2593676 RepID=UPI0024B8FF7B|nr:MULTISPECIES: hypothetical protein [unclassified Streptomyces]MDJ0345237.1 hypothetical protein [Streptomyces sp. PH10-H1]MDJ0368817.1 hypothetical protein [Streptomyces sp. H10-C2]
MPDEPSTGELGRLIQTWDRRLDMVNARFTEYVPSLLYTTTAGHTSERFAQMQAEIQQIRAERDQLEAAFEQYQRDQATRRERERQARLYQMVVPVLMGLLTSAVAIWAVVR